MRFAISVSLALGIASVGTARAQPITLGDGERLFMENCNRCHALTPSDTGKIAPAIASLDLYSFTAGLWNQSHSMFQAFVAHDWKPAVLSKDELVQVFLFTQVVAERPVEGDPARGRRFVEANRCLNCHSIGDKGARNGIPWDRFAATLHPGVVMSAVWSHRQAMREAFRSAGVPPPKFERGDLADLVAFMKEQGRPQTNVPLLMDLQRLEVEPSLFQRFRCVQCHREADFAGEPARTHQQVTEALLAHAFMPEYERPPLNELALSAADAMSLAALVSYFGHLDRPGSSARGASLFRQRNCTVCHDLPDRPDPGSNLTAIGDVADEWDFATRIFDKVPLMIEKARIESRAFPRLAPEEVGDLFAYFCSTSPRCKPVVAVPR